MTNAMLAAQTIAFAVANEGIEQVELTAPWQAILDAGGTPVLVGVELGSAQAFHHLDRGDTFEVDVTFAQALPDNYDALVLPGGVANPDALRLNAEAVAFVRSFFDAGKPVAAICHAPWMLIEADVLSGRTLTSWPSLRTDLQNAGATWQDSEVVVDGSLVTSRKPDDLPAFTEAMIALFSGARSGTSRGGALSQGDLPVVGQ